jgi:uncharacterized protein YutE (UPF0331/DUF86 family)
MVDPEIARTAIARVLHHVARLRRHSGLDAQTLRADEDLRNNVLMDLQQAIQACIDLGTHACVHDRLGSPSTAAAAFELLEGAQRIDRDLAERLIGAAGLRNLIVHQYGRIDLDIVCAVIRSHLGDLERFASAFGRE